ncbi:hypothetical protein [Streptomyces gibsoniae]|uniref:Uncharacterized protein n=1 Tax=Streptomyces gibsoniae TaxID=3075529 RepID=A0ABU2TTJ1_9ACTN|nr:hypothetical protein [Streptomyces sp. DSM 41699]MDT0464231.1 hypothetical protein [Streptomyces sp. DSM 41699]
MAIRVPPLAKPAGVRKGRVVRGTMVCPRADRSISVPVERVMEGGLQ